MKVVFLDPSTSAIGYVCATSARDIVRHKLIVPQKKSKHWTKRLNNMEFGLRRPLREDRPEKFVIEEPDPMRVMSWIPTKGKNAGKKQTSTPRGAAVYGCAVGMVYLMCRLYARQFGLDPNTAIETYQPKEWTRGSSKTHRVQCAGQHSFYRAALDPGADLADALCLCEWWFTEQYKKRLRREHA